MNEQRGRVTKDERKRVDAMRVHAGVPTDHRPVRFNAESGEWERVGEAPSEAPPRQPHVSFRKAVVIAASVGVCMFCSRPDATMRFTNDDSVRICSKCVE